MSKKILVVLSAILLVGAVHAATVTNYLKQVVTVDANGVVTSVVVDQGAATNLPRSQVALSGVQVNSAISTGVPNTIASAYTSRDIGDLLLFTSYTGAPALFISARGNSATNWSKITTVGP